MQWKGWVPACLAAAKEQHSSDCIAAFARQWQRHQATSASLIYSTYASKWPGLPAFWAYRSTWLSNCDMAGLHPFAGLWNRGKRWLLARLGRQPALTPEEVATADRQAVKDDHRKQQNRLNDLTSEKAELERKLALDLGPNSAFLPLVDQCVCGGLGEPHHVAAHALV